MSQPTDETDVPQEEGLVSAPGLESAILRDAPDSKEVRMTNAVQILKRHGIVRPDEVVKIARKEDLELAVACTLLEKESGGGRNVWGNDGVDTCGNYDKGSSVTQAAYLAYKRDRKRCGMQGVGPTQLTWWAFQDRADTRGGCWKWEVNVEVGFEIMAGYIHKHGLWEAAKRYNGADSYANDFVAKHRVWRDRLAGSQPGPHTVVAWHRANVRQTPRLSGKIVSHVAAGNSYPASCWTKGDTVTAEGYTRDIWIKLPLKVGGFGYVTAIYLKGDKYANLPASESCR